MKIFERSEGQPAETLHEEERLPWNAPLLTVASVGDHTRNNVNQLPYDFTNVRS